MKSLAIGGIAGPTAFVGAWLVGGAIRDGYSAVDDAISRLAAVGVETQPLMTAGFVAFGVGVPAYSLALRSVVAGPAWVSAFVTGVATLGVAALPLDAGVDQAHGVAAAIGYASLAATPMLAAPALKRLGHRRAALVSLAAGLVSAASLAMTTVSDANGLWQRIGLTAGDAWLVASAIWVLRR